MPLYDLSDFFSLSRALNYNLSCTTSARHYVLKYVTDMKPLDPLDKRVVMRALEFLINSYKGKTRKLGPPAVLHPLRASALFCRAVRSIEILDLVTEMFHDLFEDIYPFQVEDESWCALIRQDFIASLWPPSDPGGGEVFDRLMHLTRRDNESYYEYIGRILDSPGENAAVVRVKLADRLDNTLDMRIDLDDPRERGDFFQEVFSTLFVKAARKNPWEEDHPPSAPLNGAWRLYELFKNAVLLSLIRQKGFVIAGQGFDVLFHAVAVASWNEAKRIYLHIWAYHQKLLGDPRKLLTEAMEYCYTDRINMVTRPDKLYRLDGLFSTYFDPPRRETHPPPKTREEMEEVRKAQTANRQQKLNNLYKDKNLMVEAAVAFVVIFQNFLQDPDYYIQGISEHGIAPAEPEREA